MKVKLEKTTKVTRPKPNKKPYAPQTPDTNQPGLGKPATKITRSKKKKGKVK